MVPVGGVDATDIWRGAPVSIQGTTSRSRRSGPCNFVEHLSVVARHRYQHGCTRVEHQPVGDFVYAVRWPGRHFVAAEYVPVVCLHRGRCALDALSATRARTQSGERGAERGTRARGTQCTAQSASSALFVQYAEHNCDFDS